VRKHESQNGVFQKVGECLYRYSSNGVYYGRIKVDGKEVKRSLQTTDRAAAKRKLADFKREQGQIDRSQGKVTLAHLCDRYVATEAVTKWKRRTAERKQAIARRIKSHWPTAATLTQIGKIKSSDCDVWLGRMQKTARRFGAASRDLHISCLKEVFQLAILDKLISHSPAAHLKAPKRDKPIRLTPTFEQFRAIVDDVRSQPFNADAQDSADFLEFLGLAGLGQAEAASLIRADVNFKAGNIVTFRHKTSRGFVIPIFPQLSPLLERLCKGKSARDRIFTINNAKKALAASCARLEYPHFTQRALRRMFITRAIERGVDVKVIAEWQGHKDGGKLILDTYSHVNRVHSQRMAKLMTDGEAENVIELRGVA
jgi:integrase